MNQLAAALASIVMARIDQLASNATGEVRLIFHGPPLEILEETFSIVVEAQGGGAPLVPVVLQVPALPDGQANPPIGASGRCDQTHLLNLRNSPFKPSYIALVPPGHHSNKSVSSTTDEFGMLSANNGGNVAFEDWWADEFLQELVSGGLRHSGLSDASRDAGLALVAHASAAADEVDEERTQRAAAWRIVSRLYSAGPSGDGLSPATKVSLACGVPPMREGGISPRDQLVALDKIADALGEGFNAGVARAQDGASDAEAAWLGDFLSSLKAACDRPTAFERAPAAYYGPSRGLGLQDTTPSWWLSLTVEKWTELLDEDATATGDISMVCSNGIIPLGKGMPVLVESEVALQFETAGPDASNALVTIERTPGGPQGKQVGQVRADSSRAFVDHLPPQHRTPMRYVASAEHFKPGAIKIVSLATWSPGLFVACRLATKLSPPKRRKGKGSPEFEASLQLPGAGRYELLVFCSPQVELGDEAAGNPDDAAERGDASATLPVRQVRPRQFQIEVEVDGNYQLDLAFERRDTDGSMAQETCRVFLSVEETEQNGCRSEFERLIRANRRAIQPSEARAIVQLNRNARASSLQDWMLSADLASLSYVPTVMAEDYVDCWVQPSWSEQHGPIFSNGRFIKDPRPMATEFSPPDGFVEAREALAARIRGGGDETGLVESAPLGKWLAADDGFRELVERYLGCYQSWLAAEPDVACWVDVVAVTSLQQDGRTLARVPDAILLSPLHPLRIAWQAAAQRVLVEADEAEKPCPAASVLDPDCIPDILQMALRSASGIDHVDFVAVENGTDYWSVLWNGQQLRNLASRSQQAPFGPGFGISVGGISVGFSAAQVSRALDDVTDLLAAKPVVGISVTSAGGTTDACNEGLIGWCSDRYLGAESRPSRQSTGVRLVNVYDDRDVAARPDAARIANLSEDTGNRVRWFDGQPAGVIPDLGIIAQLDMSEPEAGRVDNKTPLGHAALVRHRVRRQLPGAFISESRQGSPGAVSGDVLADKISNCVATMENLGAVRTGLSFAPNVNAIHDMLERRKSDFVAVSSSAIDPACFLGGWLEGAYLWDYDLPSYSHRAGDTNGYYLLSRVKDADREALSKALARLPGCGGMEPASVHEVLLEVARRGIPTIRGLAGDDSGATGDLGLFLAVRLLQDRFRKSGDGHSLLPVIGGTAEDAELAIIVPVDPFRGYLSDLGRTLRKGKETSLSRPDLLVVGVRISGDVVRIHLTPVEVKCRPGSTFPATEVADALDQARNMSRLLSSMRPHEGQPRLWSLAFQHLLLSFIGFGMRVYSQHPDVVDQGQWSSFHERIAAAILAEECPVTIDPNGRLVVIDESARSSAGDRDGDGFDETIVIGAEDAGRIVAGDPAAFYDSVRLKLGNWSLLPPVVDGVRSAIGDAGNDEAKSGSPVAGSAMPVGEAEPVADVPTSRGATPVEVAATGAEGIVLALGRTVDGFTSRELSLNIADTRLNHLNMGVVGDLGTGKTQLLKSLILQISAAAETNRGVRPRFLIFDYKRDYSSADFVEATGARVVRPERLPINLFDTSTMEPTTAPWLHRYRFFADVLDKIYSGIGPVQRDKLKRAIRSAYEASLPGQPPTLYDVHAAYAEMLDGKSDSIMAIIDDLVDMEVFARSTRDTVPLDQFLDGVVVVSLDALGQDDRSKNMLVAVMLNLFYENMLRTQKRPFIGTDPQLRAIDSYLLVDEADNIMRYEFDVLRKLLLQGREFGTGIILASQYLRHFKVNSTDYREPLLTWFIHKVPNVTPAELSALGLTGSVAELAERVKSLQNHQCLYKSFDVPGEVIRGLPFFEFIREKK
ncbi:ATP-binding protein [Rhizobium leguminosarum]|uniref:ATP-binding protein n=1 Tax=Rhizobium leguminosarum TaxID=384 RepID=UPI0014427479|nr:ATP-binding protein [Rhizobium leguminosarum]MBY5867837.1 ATP-binding protein [Rhizobium leguminosarum]NKM06474.1 ATP-binding protein [Rhizobium leguminosarum bv. viciae]